MNVIVLCKKYYIDTLVKELGINNVNSNNPTYIPIDDSFESQQFHHVSGIGSKTANNVIVLCKKYYIETLVKELGINNVNSSNQAYIPIDDSFETIVKSHNNFITSVGLEMSEEAQNLPYLYWTPK